MSTEAFLKEFRGCCFTGAESKHGNSSRAKKKAVVLLEPNLEHGDSSQRN
uniref:Uncharacterized protein n=1 Tax=Strongyloides stercoralis TaxID=6248 RepID=A0A0K0ETS5_STRER